MRECVFCGRETDGITRVDFLQGGSHVDGIVMCRNCMNTQEVVMKLRGMARKKGGEKDGRNS